MQMQRGCSSLSIVIPTLNAERTLGPCLYSLTEATEAEVLVVDGGSTDQTVALARRHGAKVISAPRGRGPQLQAGARAATRAWLLFLHADTCLDAGWSAELEERLILPDRRGRIATFRFALDDGDWRAGVLEQLVAWRVRLLGLPYGDQGLVAHRTLYHLVGGYRDLPLMEDVDLVGRLGRWRFLRLAARATTSAERWRREGWVRRSLRNTTCLVLYRAGLPVERIARLYER